MKLWLTSTIVSEVTFVPFMPFRPFASLIAHHLRKIAKFEVVVVKLLSPEYYVARYLFCKTRYSSYETRSSDVVRWRCRCSPEWWGIPWSSLHHSAPRALACAYVVIASQRPNDTIDHNRMFTQAQTHFRVAEETGHKAPNLLYPPELLSHGRCSLSSL